MTAHKSHIEVRAARSTRERIASLLKRYPHVSDGDRKEILRFMKEARHLEVDLLTADDNIQPQLGAVTLIAVILIVCWLVGELFMPVSL